MTAPKDAALIDRIADGVWVGIPAPGEGAMGAVISGDEGVVIDTTSYGRFAERFLEEVATAHPSVRWRALLVTHRHFDHFAGAPAIPAPMIAHRLTRLALAGYTDGWMERNVEDWIKQGLIIPALLGESRVVLPEITFEHRLTIHLPADIEVVMMHTGGHTTDESMVYLPQQRVVFGGDNIFHQRAPFTGHGDLVTWIDALETLRTLPIDIVVPGHGPLGGAELMVDQIAQLRELHAAWVRGEA